MGKPLAGGSGSIFAAVGTAGVGGSEQPGPLNPGAWPFPAQILAQEDVKDGLAQDPARSPAEGGWGTGVTITRRVFTVWGTVPRIPGH